MHIGTPHLCTAALEETAHWQFQFLGSLEQCHIYLQVSWLATNQGELEIELMLLSFQISVIPV